MSLTYNASANAWALAEALCVTDPPLQKMADESDYWGALLAAQARIRVLEFCHPVEPRLAYKTRPEMVVERVAQGEEEGRCPQADGAFAHGVLTLELTRLSESKGKHGVQ